MTSTPDVVSALLRAVSFVLLFQAAGIAIFVVSFGARMSKTLQYVQRLGVVAALAAIACSSCQYLLEAARMSGDFPGVLDKSLQQLVMYSSSGASFVLRMAGLVLLVLSLRRTFAPRRALIGVLSAAVSFVVTGHTSVHAHHVVLAVTLLSHVLIGMFWFGALLPLWVVSLREDHHDAGGIVASFSAAAFWLVPLLLLAGVVMTAILLPGLHTFALPYGQLLILKMALFAALMLLAAANKWRFGPRIASGLPAAAAAFRKVLGAEFVLLCGVLTVTAFLTMFFSPE